MANDAEIAWAAGIFEGEGCVTIHRVKNRPHWRGLLMQLAMTDEDVVRRFAVVVGAGKVTGPYKYTGNRKPHWRWGCAKAEDVRHLATIFGPWLGERRLQAFVECLAIRDEYESLGRVNVKVS